jgi:thiaminase
MAEAPSDPEQHIRIVVADAVAEMMVQCSICNELSHSTADNQCCTFSRCVAYGRYFINYFAVRGYFIAFLTCRIGYKGLAQSWQKRSQSARADAETMTKEPSNGCMPNSDWHLFAVRSR